MVFYKYEGDDAVIVTADVDDVIIVVNSSNATCKFEEEVSCESQNQGTWQLTLATGD